MNLKIGTKEDSINHTSAFILPSTELRFLERQLRLNRFAYRFLDSCPGKTGIRGIIIPRRTQGIDAHGFESNGVVGIVI